ncbi:MAG: histidine phosphatase family protein [Verrucomicrobiales bacterium]|nr:histidine phosphatase family protein [Verrucomicrobiales bacterium]
MEFAPPPHPIRLLLIRHGEVEATYHRVFGGSRIDMGLSPLGHAQAQALTRWLAPDAISRVYASPMQRVAQTMAPLLAAKQLQPILLPDLREVDFGDWTGLNWDEVKQRFGVSAYDWLEVLDQGALPGGESAAQLAARVSPCLQRILAENPHQPVAIVCHGGIIRVILSLLLQIPLSRTAHFHIEYGSLSIVEVDPEKRHSVELDLLNFQPLLADRQPVP